MGDVQGDIAKDMRAAGLNPYGAMVGGLPPRDRQPSAVHDVREQAQRYKHALEVIRDAESLDAEALRAIAYAVIGPRLVERSPDA
jgi:hypothetical protein